VKWFHIVTPLLFNGFFALIAWVYQYNVYGGPYWKADLIFHIGAGLTLSGIVAVIWAAGE